MYTMARACSSEPYCVRVVMSAMQVLDDDPDSELTVTCGHAMQRIVLCLGSTSRPFNEKSVAKTQGTNKSDPADSEAAAALRDG